MAKRFALENDSKLDFASINKMMAKGSAYAGTLEPASEEKKEEKQNVEKADSSEQVGAVDNAPTTVEQQSEPATIVKSEKKKESKSRIKKETKRTLKKEEPEEAVAESVAEQVPVETPKSAVTSELAYPSFKEILYNEQCPGSEKESVTIRLNPDVLAKLDWLTNELPKGKKSSRGQIIENLLSFFFEKYQKKLEAMEILSNE